MLKKNYFRLNFYKKKLIYLLNTHNQKNNQKISRIFQKMKKNKKSQFFEKNNNFQNEKNL